MSLPELQYRIALTMIPGVGPVTARGLIKRFGSAGAVFTENKTALRCLGKTGEAIAEHTRSPAILQAAEREMEFTIRFGIRVLWFGDKTFPFRLNQCHDGPVLLYMLGNLDLNASKCISIVGTRRATPFGIDMCRSLVKGLAAKFPGLVIISGLAYGIDVTAHRAALEFGLPTAGVLGHGMHTIYPKYHRDDARKISGTGALVTDFDSNTGPERNNFLRRNRIIAGLSDATLVVESPERGGALVTADIAFSYDRLVMAVPGRPSDEKSAGCNRLIKNDVAALTETTADVSRYTNWKESQNILPSPSLFTSADPSWNTVLGALQKHRGATPELLGKLTGFGLPDVMVILLQLELEGLVACGPGNQYRIRTPA